MLNISQKAAQSIHKVRRALKEQQKKKSLFFSSVSTMRVSINRQDKLKNLQSEVRPLGSISESSLIS